MKKKRNAIAPSLIHLNKRRRSISQRTHDAEAEVDEKTHGAYLRIMASKLIFRAARLYLSDSSRNELDIVDISESMQQSESQLALSL